jgi:hypothetical protein
MKTTSAKATKTRPTKTAISTRLPPVDVEYDGAKGKRVIKHFVDAHAAKRFYAAQDKKGKRPKVAAGKVAVPTQAKASKAKREPKPERAERLPKKYMAGMLLRRHGLEANLDKLVAELDKMAGTSSPVQTRFDLQHASNAVRGWLAAEAK